MSKKFTRLFLFFIIFIIVLAFCLTKFINTGNELPYNNYNISNFNGTDFKTYEDDEYTSILGVDLCDFDEVYDFEALKNAGIEFVYLRVGFRGYGDKGTIYKDDNFERYYTSAKQYGFKIGVYFFSQALNNEELEEEVNFIFENIQGKQIDLPIAYDFEYIYEEDARSDNLDSEMLTSNMELFCRLVEEKGYKSIVYTNLDMIRNESFDLNLLFSHDVWYAQYYDVPECIYPYSIWQYGVEIKIDGVEEGVDMNIMLIKKENN